MEDLAVELFKINAVKFGDFTTKIGIYTPVYFDLRVIVSYPSLMEKLADLMMAKMKSIDDQKLICGVPYTALPIATLISHKTKIPMVMRRKETKSYGTKRTIEGVFRGGDTCLIVEDVVTSGSSILETVKDLRNSDIICKDAIVLINREQSGQKFLSDNGIKMHSLLTLSELINILLEKKLIDGDVKIKIDKYLSETVIKTENFNNFLTEDRLKLSLLDRCKLSKNQIAQNLFRIMAQKSSNLCVAADLTDPTDILNFAETVGPFICCLKTHVDIIEDFHVNFVKRLKEISTNHNFLLMEDRKFSDIGNTVQLQFSKGIFQIQSWADCVTVHSLFGKSPLDAIEEANSKSGNQVGVFLLAEASSSGCLIDENYTENTLKLASQYEKLVTGIVCQNPLFRNYPGFLQLTPGVQIGETKDGLGQIYNSPEKIIMEKGGDIAVVGRGISNSKNVMETAKIYQEQLWDSLKRRVEK